MKILTNFYKVGFRYVLSVGIITLLAACVTQQGSGLRPSDKEFKSEWLDINLGTMIGKRGGKPELLLQLANKKPQTVWVKVRFEVPEQNQSCEITKQIMSNKIADYICPQNVIVADIAYPIYFEIFSNEGLTDLVEKTKTKMQFGKQDVDAFMKWLIPPALPATFKKIVYTEEFGVFNALFGAFKSSGTLVVRENNIEYTQGDTVINIPTSHIRSVKKREIQSGIIWVVVEYQVSGKNKIIGFKGSAFIGSTDIGELDSTLSYVYENKKQ